MSLVRKVLLRIAAALLTVFIAATLAFLALQIIPGDAAEAALSQSTASQAVLEARRAALGLDQPVSIQYLRYISGLFRGDLGISWATGEPVSSRIGRVLRPTASLAAVAIGFAMVFGLPLGIAAAADRGWSAVLSRVLASLGIATPVMFSGTLAIWLFAVLLGWLPATGQGSLLHLVMPGVVLGFSVMGGIARVTEASIAETLSHPFIRTAYAKGLSRRVILWRHAFRAGLLPVLDTIALQFGYLLAGTVITESVFARQGLGRVLLQAVLDQDLPVVQGAVVLAAGIYVILGLLADVAQMLADPRLRREIAA